jgi:Protein of unknown function (DUF4238)
MADHKNQHFVPRCVLKPFTLNNEDKAINLYTLRADRLIQNAPVKHQSARDYLYGEDGVIEAGLAQLEGQYSSALDQVREGWDSEDDRSTLRFFAYLQLRRTEMAIQRIEASDAELFQQIFGHEEPERPSQRYYMVQSLKACFVPKKASKTCRCASLRTEPTLSSLSAMIPLFTPTSMRLKKLGERCSA